MNLPPSGAGPRATVEGRSGQAAGFVVRVSESKGRRGVFGSHRDDWPGMANRAPMDRDDLRSDPYRRAEYERSPKGPPAMSEPAPRILSPRL